MLIFRLQDVLQPISHVTKMPTSSPRCSTCGTGQVASNVGLQHGGSSEGRRSSGRQKGKEKRERRGDLLCLHPSGQRFAQLLLLPLMPTTNRAVSGQRGMDRKAEILLSPRCSTCGTGQVASNVGLQHGGSSEGRRSSGRQKGKEKRERRGDLLCLHPSGMDRKAEILLMSFSQAAKLAGCQDLQVKLPEGPTEAEREPGTGFQSLLRNPPQNFTSETSPPSLNPVGAPSPGTSCPVVTASRLLMGPLQIGTPPLLGAQARDSPLNEKEVTTEHP
ncbi:uncharacterized protein WM277_006582 [Molossus nigricans]